MEDNKYTIDQGANLATLWDDIRSLSKSQKKMSKEIGTIEVPVKVDEKQSLSAINSFMRKIDESQDLVTAIGERFGQSFETVMASAGKRGQKGQQQGFMAKISAKGTGVDSIVELVKELQGEPFKATTVDSLTKVATALNKISLAARRSADVIGGGGSAAITTMTVAQDDLFTKQGQMSGAEVDWMGDFFNSITNFVRRMSIEIPKVGESGNLMHSNIDLFRRGIEHLAKKLPDIEVQGAENWQQLAENISEITKVLSRPAGKPEWIAQAFQDIAAGMREFLAVNATSVKTGLDSIITSFLRMGEASAPMRDFLAILTQINRAGTPGKGGVMPFDAFSNLLDKIREVKEGVREAKEVLADADIKRLVDLSAASKQMEDTAKQAEGFAQSATKVEQETTAGAQALASAAAESEEYLKEVEAAAEAARQAAARAAEVARVAEAELTKAIEASVLDDEMKESLRKFSDYLRGYTDIQDDFKDAVRDDGTYDKTVLREVVTALHEIATEVDSGKIPMLTAAFANLKDQTRELLKKPDMAEIDSGKLPVAAEKYLKAYEKYLEEQDKVSVISSGYFDNVLNVIKTYRQEIGVEAEEAGKQAGEVSAVMAEYQSAKKYKEDIAEFKTTLASYSKAVKDLKAVAKGEVFQEDDVEAAYGKIKDQAKWLKDLDLSFIDDKWAEYFNPTKILLKSLKGEDVDRNELVGAIKEYVKQYDELWKLYFPEKKKANKAFYQAETAAVEAGEIEKAASRVVAANRKVIESKREEKQVTEEGLKAVIGEKTAKNLSSISESIVELHRGQSEYQTSIVATVRELVGLYKELATESRAMADAFSEMETPAGRVIRAVRDAKKVIDLEEEKVLPQAPPAAGSVLHKQDEGQQEGVATVLRERQKPAVDNFVGSINSSDAPLSKMSANQKEISASMDQIYQSMALDKFFLDKLSAENMDKVVKAATKRLGGIQKKMQTAMNEWNVSALSEVKELKEQLVAQGELLKAAQEQAVRETEGMTEAAKREAANAKRRATAAEKGRQRAQQEMQDLKLAYEKEKKEATLAFMKEKVAIAEAHKEQDRAKLEEHRANLAKIKNDAAIALMEYKQQQQEALRAARKKERDDAEKEAAPERKALALFKEQLELLRRIKKAQSEQGKPEQAANVVFWRTVIEESKKVLLNLDDIKEKAQAVDAETFNRFAYQFQVLSHEIEGVVEKADMRDVKKNFDTQKESVGLLSGEFNLFKKTMGSLDEATKREGLDAFLSQVELLQRELAVLGAETPGQDALKQKLDRLIVDMATEQNKMDEPIAKGMSNRTIFAIQRWLRRGFSVLFRQAKQFAQEFGDSLNEIRIVTQKTKEESEALGRTYLAIAKQMRLSATEVTRGAVALYRQGLGDTQVFDRLVKAAEFAKVASIGQEQAIDIITVAINTGLVESAERATDVLVALGDAAATNAEEISTAMQRSAAVAKMAGVDYEHLATWIALVSERTRLGADMIGTSIQSVLARMHQMRQTGYSEDGMSTNMIEVALQRVGKEIGINLSLFEEGSRKWKESQDVVEELADAWSSMDDIQKSYIVTVMSGIRQQDRWVNLLDAMSDKTQGLSRYEQLLGVAMSANGTTSEKYAIAIESVSAAHDSMTTALQKLYDIVGSSDALRWFYDMFANVINLFTTGYSRIGAQITPIVVLTGAVIALSRAFKALNVEAGLGGILKGGKLGAILGALMLLATVVTSIAGSFGGKTEDAQTSIKVPMSDLLREADDRIEASKREIVALRGMIGNQEELRAKYGKAADGMTEYQTAVKAILIANPDQEKSLKTSSGEFKGLSEVVEVAVNKLEEYTQAARDAARERLNLVIAMNIEVSEETQARMHILSMMANEDQGLDFWKSQLNVDMSPAGLHAGTSRSVPGSGPVLHRLFAGIGKLYPEWSRDEQTNVQKSVIQEYIDNYADVREYVKEKDQEQQRGKKESVEAIVGLFASDQEVIGVAKGSSIIDMYLDVMKQEFAKIASTQGLEDLEGAREEQQDKVEQEIKRYEADPHEKGGLLDIVFDALQSQFEMKPLAGDPGEAYKSRFIGLYSEVLRYFGESAGIIFRSYIGKDPSFVRTMGIDISSMIASDWVNKWLVGTGRKVTPDSFSFIAGPEGIWGEEEKSMLHEFVMALKQSNITIEEFFDIVGSSNVDVLRNSQDEQANSGYNLNTIMDTLVEVFQKAELEAAKKSGFLEQLEAIRKRMTGVVGSPVAGAMHVLDAYDPQIVAAMQDVEENFMLADYLLHPERYQWDEFLEWFDQRIRDVADGVTEAKKAIDSFNDSVSDMTSIHGQMDTLSRGGTLYFGDIQPLLGRFPDLINMFAEGASQESQMQQLKEAYGGAEEAVKKTLQAALESDEDLMKALKASGVEVEAQTDRLFGSISDSLNNTGEELRKTWSEILRDMAKYSEERSADLFFDKGGLKRFVAYQKELHPETLSGTIQQQAIGEEFFEGIRGDLIFDKILQDYPEVASQQVKMSEGAEDLAHGFILIDQELSKIDLTVQAETSDFMKEIVGLQEAYLKGGGAGAAAVKSVVDKYEEQGRAMSAMAYQKSATEKTESEARAAWDAIGEYLDIAINSSEEALESFQYVERGFVATLEGIRDVVKAMLEAGEIEIRDGSIFALSSDEKVLGQVRLLEILNRIKGMSIKFNEKGGILQAQFGGVPWADISKADSLKDFANKMLEINKAMAVQQAKDQGFAAELQKIVEAYVELGKAGAIAEIAKLSVDIKEALFADESAQTILRLIDDGVVATEVQEKLYKVLSDINILKASEGVGAATSPLEFLQGASQQLGRGKPQTYPQIVEHLQDFEWQPGILQEPIDKQVAMIGAHLKLKEADLQKFWLDFQNAPYKGKDIPSGVQEKNEGLARLQVDMLFENFDSSIDIYEQAFEDIIGTYDTNLSKLIQLQEQFIDNWLDSARRLNKGAQIFEGRPHVEVTPENIGTMQGWGLTGLTVGGTVTTASQVFGDVEGARALIVTPILPTGEILSQETLREYVDAMFAGTATQEQQQIFLGEIVGEDAVKRAEELSAALEHIHGLFMDTISASSTQASSWSGQRLPGLEKDGKILEGFSDSQKKVKAGGLGAVKATQSMSKAVASYVKAQRAANLIQEDGGKKTEETSEAFDTLAEFTGYSVEEQEGNLLPALSMLEYMNTQVTDTLNELAEQVGLTGTANQDSSQWIAELMALDGSTDASIAQLQDQVRQVLIAGKMALIANRTADGSIYFTSRGADFAPAPRSTGGGKRSGGGGGSRDTGPKMSEIEKMLDKISRQKAIDDFIRRMTQLRGSYYQTAGELTNYIAALEREAALIESRNKVDKSALRSMEDKQRAQQSLVASMSTTSSEYQQALSDQDALQSAHQEYTEIQQQNEIDLLEQQQAITETRRTIRGMQIELREQVMEAVQDHYDLQESMLQGRLSVEEEILNAIRKRYEDEWSLLQKDIEKKRKALSEEMALINERLQERKRVSDLEDQYKKLAEQESQLAIISADPTRAKDQQDLIKQIASLREDLSWKAAEEEVRSQQKSIEEQLKSLEDYATWMEEYYKGLLEAPSNFAAEVNAVFIQADADLMAWATANIQNFSEMTVEQQAATIDRVHQLVYMTDEEIHRWMSENVINFSNQTQHEQATLIDNVTRMAAEGNAYIVGWLQQHNEEFANATALQQQNMTNSWNSMMLEMHGAIETHWREVEEIIAGGDDAIIAYLMDNHTGYRTAGRLQAEAYLDEWRQRLDDLRRALQDTANFAATLSYSVPAPYEGSSGGGGGGGGGGGTDPTHWKFTFAGQEYKHYTSGESAKAKIVELLAAKEKAGTSLSLLLSYESAAIKSLASGKHSAGYRGGGYAYDTGYQLLHGSPHAPEAVLSAQQTSIFRDFVDSMMCIASPTTPKISRDNFKDDPGGVNIDSIVVNVDSLDDDADYEEVARRIGNAIYKDMTVRMGSAVNGVIRY